MDKRQLRHKLLAQREQLTDHASRSLLITQALTQVLEARADRCIGAYYPIRGEYNPLPALLSWAAAHPERVLGLPVITAVDAPLVFHEYTAKSQLMQDAYGIPIPKAAREIAPSLLLIPCLGFTRTHQGLYRLGYGAGHYDRTLAALAQKHPPVATMGLCFDAGNAAFPIEPHDVPLDGVLTESSFITA